MIGPAAPTEPELHGLLVSPDFTEALFEAAHHTLNTGSEAGLAVYRAASGLLVSQVIHAEDHTPEGRKPSDSIDLRSITHESEDTVRPDLAVHLHTHPDGHWNNQLLSAADMQLHAIEDRQVPGLIGMMAMPRAGASVVQLTLLRARPGKEGMLRCQHINRLGNDASYRDIQEAMEHAGMSGSHTSYD
ncbi:MAG TPA: hypothetical protein VF466_02420, partial [Candidatus Saccharimonadales bacterium]